MDGMKVRKLWGSFIFYGYYFNLIIKISNYIRQEKWRKKFYQ